MNKAETILIVEQVNRRLGKKRPEKNRPVPRRIKAAGGNFYAEEFWLRCEKEFKENPRLQWQQARARVQLTAPNLYRAAFGQKETDRFNFAVFHHLDEGLTEAAAFKEAERNLPGDAQFIAASRFFQ